MTGGVSMLIGEKSWYSSLTSPAISHLPPISVGSISKFTSKPYTQKEKKKAKLYNALHLHCWHSGPSHHGTNLLTGLFPSLMIPPIRSSHNRLRDHFQNSIRSYHCSASDHSKASNCPLNKTQTPRVAHEALLDPAFGPFLNFAASSFHPASQWTITVIFFPFLKFSYLQNFMLTIPFLWSALHLTHDI